MKRIEDETSIVAFEDTFQALAKKAKVEAKNDTNYVAVKGRLVHYNVNRLNRYDGMIGQPKIVTCTRIPIQRANKEESNPKPSIPPPQSNHSSYSSQLSSPNLLYSVSNKQLLP